MTRRLPAAVVPWVYLAGSMLLLAPSVMSLGQTIPGAARSDVWNSLWSMWFVADAFQQGSLPWFTHLLDHPNGGVLLVADPVGATAAAPITLALGVEVAYSVLMVVRVALAGWSAHLLAAEVLEEGGGASDAPFVAGAAMMLAPVLVSGIHNGTSEAAAIAPVAVSAWLALRAVRTGRWSFAVMAGLALVWSTLASGYAAVAAFIFVGCVSLAHPLRRELRREVSLRVAIPALGLAGGVPVAMAISRAATIRGNLVGIKHGAELASVRRTTGPADPLAYLLGFDYRSPDFRVISRYGEDFIHSPYVGWVIGVVAAWGLWRRRDQLGAVGWLLLAGLATLLLSLGPVVVHQGLAWVFLDERVVPLPYLLLERLPGFGSLSLLWRLAVGPTLVCAVLAAKAAGTLSRRQVWAVVALVVVESTMVAPTGGMPTMTDARLHTGLSTLAESPEGAVLNHPVVGGRAYLHEQTAHGHPLAARLNFPNNGVGRVVWESARKAVSLSDDAARKQVRNTAQNMGVRYIVVHDDPDAGPDMYDEAVVLMRRVFPALDGDGPRAQTGPHAADLVVLRLY